MNKLNAKDFLIAAVRNAGTEPAALRALRERLDQHDSFDVSECLASIRKLVRFARLPNLSAPPRDENRIRWACSPLAMAALNTTPLQLFALAAIEAAQRFPQDFGCAS